MRPFAAVALIERKIRRFRRPPVRSPAGGAALFALMLISAQLLLAMHDAHDLAGGGDRATCAVCLLGHGLDNAPTPAAPLSFEPAGQASESVSTLCVSHPQCIRNYPARGPPSRQIHG